MLTGYPLWQCVLAHRDLHGECALSTARFLDSDTLHPQMVAYPNTFISVAIEFLVIKRESLRSKSPCAD